MPASPTSNCLAIAGAAQQSVYADSGSTAVHGQVLRDPPTAPAWSHFAVQAVVLFPTAQAAAEFFTTSRQRWAGCSNRELSYPQPLGPEQVWSVGQTSTDHDVLAVSRVQESPERWACQRALTVHSNVAVDVEACSLDGPTSAAAAIAGQIARAPARGLAHDMVWGWGRRSDSLSWPIPSPSGGMADALA